MNFIKTVKPIKLGRQLGVAESDLDVVKKNHPNDCDEQLEDVLSLYMRQSLDPSWEEVATALWNIGEKRTAQQIADEYGMAFSMCSSMHQISYILQIPVWLVCYAHVFMNMISACHHATLQSNVLLLSPYTACSLYSLYSRVPSTSSTTCFYSWSILLSPYTYFW